MISARFQVFKKLGIGEMPLMVSRKAEGTNGSGRTAAGAESALSRANRGWLRPVLLMLAGLVGLLAPTLVSAKPKPDLVVRSVLEPVPPGAQPGGGMFLQANVKARNRKGRKAQVVFYFAQNSMPGADDVQVASASIGSTPGSNTAVGVAAHVPAEMPPGFYFVLACAGAGNCAASEGTIQVVGQSLSALNQSPGTISSSARQPEYFPERPADGMSVGSAFACPFSFHGQWPGICVWVTTRVFKGAPDDVGGFNYCPMDHPYPYEVAIGFDPLWLDLGNEHAVTNSVSFTKYHRDSSDNDQSYAGLDPTDAAQRGYAVFDWNNDAPINGQVQFLCTDQPSMSGAP